LTVEVAAGMVPQSLSMDNMIAVYYEAMW